MFSTTLSIFIELATKTTGHMLCERIIVNNMFVNHISYSIIGIFIDDIMFVKIYFANQPYNENIEELEYFKNIEEIHVVS